MSTHADTTFCWAELATSDATAAKAFYGHLLGWRFRDDPIPGGGAYCMGTLNDRNVGAMYELSDEMKANGVPPHWMNYVKVASVDDTVAKASALGATIVVPPMDVMTHGRMAVLADPAGATFSLWQPGDHCGNDFNDNTPGSVAWVELATRDIDKSRAFYPALFGWTTQETPVEGMDYTQFQRDGVSICGAMAMTAEWGDAPSHWMTYFAVADCDASAQTATERGGKVCVPPSDIPGVGRFAIIDDPQGATCSIITLSAQPVS